jgi:hypothetical protein
VGRHDARALHRIRRVAAAGGTLARRAWEGARISAGAAVRAVRREIPAPRPGRRRAVGAGRAGIAAPGGARAHAAGQPAAPAIVLVGGKRDAVTAARLPCAAGDPASSAVRGVRLPVHALPVALDLRRQARRLLRPARGRGERESDRGDGKREWAAEHAAMIAPFRPRSIAPRATLRYAPAERRGPAC